MPPARQKGNDPPLVATRALRLTLAVSQVTAQTNRQYAIQASPSTNMCRSRRRIGLSVWPVHGYEVWPNDMPMLGGAFMRNVMCKVSAIPKHNILTKDWLAVYPFANLRIHPKITASTGGAFVAVGWIV